MTEPRQDPTDPTDSVRPTEPVADPTAEPVAAAPVEAAAVEPIADAADGDDGEKTLGGADPADSSVLVDDEAIADEPAADEAVADEAVAPAGAAGAVDAPVRRCGPVVARTVTRAPTPSETAVHIDDRVSKAFVVLVAATFAAILLWGFLGGHGGVLTSKPTPAPSVAVSASRSESPSASPSGSAVVSASPSSSAPSPSPSPSAS
jgi:hypothetical protein